MNCQTYGYIRAQGSQQDKEVQIIQIQSHQIEMDHIFIDSLDYTDASGSDFERLLKTIKSGDLIVLPSISCLGRDYQEMMKQWKIITKEKKADLMIADMPMIDTRKTGSDFSDLSMAEIVLNILNYIVDTEREYLRRKQADGIAMAKAKGVQFGRREKTVPNQFHLLKKDYLSGQISARNAAKQLNIAHSTFLKWIKEKNDEIHL